MINYSKSQNMKPYTCLSCRYVNESSIIKSEKVELSPYADDDEIMLMEIFYTMIATGKPIPPIDYFLGYFGGKDIERNKIISAPGFNSDWVHLVLRFNRMEDKIIRCYKELVK